MPNDYLPGKKGELFTWTNNFITVVTANLTTIGFTPGDTSMLNAVQTNFSAAINGVTAAKQAQKSAVQAEKTATKNLTNLVRADVRRIQSNQNVTPTLKGSLGINPRSAPKDHSPPITPIDLMVTGYANGVNSLKWKRAGNKSNTVFGIEAKIGASTEFVGVGNSTSLKFDHAGQVPGVQVIYRIVATRAGQDSAPSIAATAYGEGMTTGLTLLKAA